MLRLDSRTRRLAAALSSLAGYVDSVGYLSLGGYFVSFMSGNSTRLGVGAAGHDVHALEALGLIAVFVFGVALGTIVARRSGQPKATVIAWVSVLIASAAVFRDTGAVAGSGFTLAFAMGVENSAFAAEGGLPVGLTYMTGTLVKIGQQLGVARSPADVRQCWPYILHWFALLAGAIAGALAFTLIGPWALWPAAAGAGCLALIARRP